MVRLNIPANAPNIIKTIDLLIKEPHLELPSPVLAQRLGHYAKPLIKNKMLTIYYNDNSPSVAILRAKSVKKKRGRGYAANVEYLFDDIIMKLPTVEIP